MGSHAAARLSSSRQSRCGYAPIRALSGSGHGGLCAELLQGPGLEELDRVAGAVVPELKTGGAEPLDLGGNWFQSRQIGERLRLCALRALAATRSS